MIRQFHRLREDEEGQSLVIACVALLVLALGVMTTLNLGRAIHQRVGLQNTADASSYSMAAMEARAFNYYAFANRTQIVHYVSAMIFMSYLSFFSFVLAIGADLLAVFMTLDAFCGPDAPACMQDVVCKVLEAIPVVGEILDAIISIIATVTAALQAIVLSAIAIFDTIDRLIGAVVVPALQMLNWVMFGSTELLRAAVSTDIATSYPEVITKNDDQVGADVPNVQRIAAGVASEAAFQSAHDSSSQPPHLPDNNYTAGDQDPVAEAKRVMGELTNATRTNNFVTSRLLSNFFPAPLKNVATDITTLLNTTGVFKKFGQTKFTSMPVGENPSCTNSSCNYIHSTGFGSSVLAQGNVLGADDLYRIGFGPNTLGIGPLSVNNPLVTGDPAIQNWRVHGAQPPSGELHAFTTSVWAQKNGGRHYQLMPNWGGGADLEGNHMDSSDQYGLHKGKLLDGIAGILLGMCNPDKYSAVIGADPRDQQHNWQGITPFMNFAISSDPTVQFKQPSAFAFLNKSYAETTRDHQGDIDRLAATEEDEDTAVAGVGSPTRIDTKNEATMPMGLQSKQFNVISRGMVYYHRPHNWEEPANFFNPYWRPKLDPVIIGLDELPGVGPVIKSAIPAQISGRTLVH